MKLVTRSQHAALHRASTPARALSGEALLSELGRDLRSLYAGLLSEPVPEHLAHFVRALEAQEARVGIRHH